MGVKFPPSEAIWLPNNMFWKPNHSKTKQTPTIQILNALGIQAQLYSDYGMKSGPLWYQTFFNRLYIRQIYYSGDLKFDQSKSGAFEIQDFWRSDFKWSLWSGISNGPNYSKGPTYKPKVQKL